MSHGPSYFAAADAYEADAANVRLTGTLGAHDGAWLDWANALTRAVALLPSLQSRYLKMVIASHGGEEAFGDAPAVEAVVRHSIALAAEAQDNDAFATGMLILDLARAVTPVTHSRFHGRMLAEQGRILQNLGELDAARELYGEVERLARWTEDGELLARAHVGIGSLAHLRGKTAESRRRFGAVLAQAPSTAQMAELHAIAKQALSPADAPTSERAIALELAWKTYRAQPEDFARRVETLLNIASLLRSVGALRAALNAYLTALAMPTIRRLRLTALSNGALVAAQMGDRAILEQLAEATERLIDHVGHQHEAADAERALAEAWFLVGENREAGRLKIRGLARVQGRFHDVEEELLAIGSVKTLPQPLVLPESVRPARDAFAYTDSHALLAVARAGPDW